MGKVSLVKTDRGIRQAVSRALELLGGLGRHVARGDRVLLKPNLNGVEGCTDRELVEALIRLLSDFGVGKVFLAESTFGTREKTDMLFHETGYRELAKKFGVRLCNLNESEEVEVAVKHPLVLEKLRIAKEYFEADRIFNLPSMKVHYTTGISLAMKNLKGLLVGDAKRLCHEVGLDEAIVDLNNTIRPQLNIVDAISCMERMGPRGGDIVRLGLVMAGERAAEVDCIGAAVMGYAIDEVRHLRYYLEANRLAPAGIEVVGERIEDVRYPFKKVDLSAILPGKFTIHDRNACSSCMNAFLQSCSHLENGPEYSADVHMGSKTGGSGSSGDMPIAFGNCCPPDREYDIRIRGCPPYSLALKESLKGRRR